MVEIEKTKVGKIKKIRIGKKEYDEIKEICEKNIMHYVEIEITRKYNLKTLTEGHKLMMAVTNNYKYLEVV